MKYIAATANSFRRIPDPDERIKFILAAYNAGIGHITDAMALAEKYGKNKYIPSALAYDAGQRSFG